MVQTSEDTRVDVALIDRVVARDPGAIAELYDRHSRLLFSLILRILKERGESEDVLQEVFVSVWTKAETYKPTLGSPAAWLVGIARHRAIDRLRVDSVRLRVLAGSYSRPLADSPESQAARGEQLRDVTRALDALPPEQRALIEDAYFLGLTQSELAARFGLPLGTVKTRVRLGMVALRKQLHENFIER